MSKQRRGGLGRGIGALIPTGPPGGQAAGGTPAATGTTGHTATAVIDSPTAPRESDDSPKAAVSNVSTPEPVVSDASPETQSPQATQTTDESWSDEGLADVPGATFALLPISAIRANDSQPRQVFDPQALDELTHSVREFGVLQPIVVRPDVDGHYELVMGERRLRASEAAGLDEIPAIIRGTADEAMLRDALLENIHRVALNPLEEAAAYQQLLEEFNVTHEELAKRLGRSRSLVSNTIRLMNLSIPVQRRVAAGVLSAGHARALLTLTDADQQDELAARIVAEGLSVRATEELVALAAREDATPKRRASAPKISAPGVADLAEKLSDTFDTRVRVDLGRRKGKITVEFGSIDDLERIVAMMAPGLATTAGNNGASS